MNIRRATESDYKELMGLYNAFVGSERYSGLNNDSFAKVLAEPRSFVYVADDDGKLVDYGYHFVKNL